MAVDFKALLSKPVDDVKRPPALPAGTYHGMITKYAFVESRFENRDTGEKDPQVKYSLRADRADESVDAALLEGIELQKRQLSIELPLGGGNEWITTELWKKLGIATAGRTMGECAPEAVNAAVTFDVTSTPNTKDPEGQPFNNVRMLRPQQ